MALDLKKCLHRRKSDCRQQQASHKKGRKSLILYVAAALLMVVSLSGMIYYKISQTAEKPNVMVKIDSHPSDAQVFIDGILKGNTPMQIGLYKGKYEVRISKPRYHHWEVQVNLDEDGEVPLYGELMPVDSGILEKGD
jgi:hypothetical protein